MRIRAWHLGAVVAAGIALLVVGVVALLAASVAGAQVRPVDAGDQKQVEMLQKNAILLDVDAAKASKMPDGQRRVVQTLAKQFKVQDTMVTDLRNRQMGYGEIAVAFALSQELMKTDKNLSQQAALDKVLAQRKTGIGWGMIARNLGLKLGNVISEVKKADAHVAKPDRMSKTERPDKVQRVDRPEKPEKATR